MDFLDIRKKAKERAQARAAEPAADASRETPPPSPRAIASDQERIEGALAARLQELPRPGAAPGADARFTTWRPGAEAPPAIPPPPELGPDLHVALAEDFTVLAPGTAIVPAPPDRREPPAVAEPQPPRDPLEDFFYRPDETAPAVPELAPAARADEPPAVLAREEYLTFLLGAEEYAVAIERVREVLRAPPVTEVPRAPEHILGVVTVRGEVVAVIDPRRRLGLPARDPGEPEAKLVVVDAGDGCCGLLVDHVASVVRLAPGSIEPCPQGIAGQRGEFLAGIGRAGERLFTVLDLGALLRPPERPEHGSGVAAGSSSRPRRRRTDAGA
jgi:purine-binding chemotaxis protein CheW